jgi:TonB-linked SusC/RagA family outer membrane protein
MNGNRYSMASLMPLSKFLPDLHLFSRQINKGIAQHKQLTSLSIMLAFSIQVSAAAQAQLVTLNKKNLAVEQVFKLIKQQTGYVSLYDDKNLASKIVSIDVKNSTVDEAVRECLKDMPFTFKIVNKNILIKHTPDEKELQPASKSQQDKVIKGKVVDNNNNPLPGVSVRVKGSTIATVTNADGGYTISTPSGATLIFTMIGFSVQEIPVGNSQNLNVTLLEESSALNEVVVIGYGTQKKANITTAVSSVSAENIKERPALNFGEAIAGQMAGVQVQQTGGAPGGEGLSIRVRGVGSITQSSDPLYVVDGYPMEGSAFRLLNTADIESVQVLKDASSTAIYGSRGANGVVIVTTKKGKVGPPTINVSTFAGFQQIGSKIEMMNRDQYVDWFVDGRNQAWLDAKVIDTDPDQTPHSASDPNSRRNLYSGASTQYNIPDGTGGYKYNFRDPASVATMPDNDWQDLLFRTALTTQNEVSVSGGTENTQYTFSGSYAKQEGIVLGTNYDRFNFRSNINSKVSKRITLGANLMAYTSNAREQESGKYSPVMFALQLPSIFPLRNEDGTYGSMVRNPEILAGDVTNPIGVAEQVLNTRKRYGWLGTVSGELEILQNLKYKVNINGGIQDNQQKIFEASYIDFDASKGPRPARGVNQRGTDYDWVIENTLNYAQTFGEKHVLSGLIGYTTQKHSFNNMFGEARGFANDEIKTLNAGTMYALTSNDSEYSMISYLGRVNYAYNDKYLLTATFRGDGSSRFGMNRRWGTFPSVSAGWRVSQEKFMQRFKQISDLKIRAGYGIVGNNRIGDYSAIGLLNSGFYPTGNTLQNTANPNTMENMDLGWEKTRQYNLGFELGIVNDRIRIEGDFYDSQSIDLLLNVPLPVITGYSTQIQNIGKVQNRGMEFLVTTRNLIGDFKWSTNFNISFNKNKVLAVGPDNRPIYGSAPNANNAFITTIGSPIASFYGYKYEGVFMSQEELDRYPHLSADKVGDGRYADLNGDGVLDQNDKTILGDNNPDFLAGMTNNFSYKNFSLGVQFTASYGAKLFSFYKRMVGIYHGDRNGMIEQVDRWRSPEQPGDGVHFRATRTPSGWQRDPSSAWIQDASYLRLRNVNLAYDFNKSFAEKLRLRALRVYVTGTNLFTITKYTGYDPETSSEGTGLTKGGDYLGYPTARTFIFGANFTF